MNNVLYEVSPNFNYSWLIIPAIVVLIVVFVVPFLIKKQYRNKNMKYTTVAKLFVGIFVVLWALACILFSSIIYLGQRYEFEETVAPYYRGEYQVVEGYVENFNPLSEGGREVESFEINGVKFSYSIYSIQMGYNKNKAHGGVITGDGQHLRIRYIYAGKNLGNVILYIEEIPD